MNFVKCGTQCYISCKGHNDFLYPDKCESATTLFTEDSSVRIKSWVCGDNSLAAVLVEAQNIESLVASPGIETVVWVKRKEILNDI
ncbi:hypothetical protein CMI37_23810 [Candidatus Pacearchaeota archaeon]|nr:hypothetical protein [Candidatus Pacearchaeota archaeon]